MCITLYFDFEKFRYYLSEIFIPSKRVKLDGDVPLDSHGFYTRFATSPYVAKPHHISARKKDISDCLKNRV